MTRIPGLSTLIKALITVCNVIDRLSPSVRRFVPEESQADFDAALLAIKGGCDVIRAIDYLDSVAGTTPLWGSRG